MGNKYLPPHYTPKEQPFFIGKGHLSISKLESLLEDYEEYKHQQQIIKQNILAENQQLLEQRNELVKALEDMVKIANLCEWQDAVTGRQIIYKNAIGAIKKSKD